MYNVNAKIMRVTWFVVYKFNFQKVDFKLKIVSN